MLGNRFIYRNAPNEFVFKISLESCTIITMQSDNVVREQSRCYDFCSLGSYLNF